MALTFSYDLAGVQYRNQYDVVGISTVLSKLPNEQLTIAMPSPVVRLFLEDDNEYDPNAIRVEVFRSEQNTWASIGYIPMKENEQLRTALSMAKLETLTLKNAQSVSTLTPYGFNVEVTFA